MVKALNGMEFENEAEMDAHFTKTKSEKARGKEFALDAELDAQCTLLETRSAYNNAVRKCDIVNVPVFRAAYEKASQTARELGVYIGE